MKTFFYVFLFAMLMMDGCHSQSVDENIVFVNIGPYNKGKIAKLISSVNALSPKVISLDIAFPEYTGNKDDKSLYQALLDVEKLVLPSEISYEGQDYQGRDVISVYLTCASEFFVPNAKFGFVSAAVAENQTTIPQKFAVWQKGSYSEDVYHHFSVVTAMAFDSLKTSRFVESHKRLVDLDYKDGKRKFKTFSASDVLDRKLTKNDVEGKIVMMGFLGPGMVDKFVIPFNGTSKEPDMYGLEYLGNIVAQVLEHGND